MRARAGRPGVILAGQNGPGATNLVTGLVAGARGVLAGGGARRVAVVGARLSRRLPGGRPAGALQTGHEEDLDPHADEAHSGDDARGLPHCAHAAARPGRAQPAARPPRGSGRLRGHRASPGAASTRPSAATRTSSHARRNCSQERKAAAHHRRRRREERPHARARRSRSPSSSTRRSPARRATATRFRAAHPLYAGQVGPRGNAVASAPGARKPT